jgi:(1->4)-alpha-D-glucan 1-alpha-D-glucosylmutase
MSPVRATIRLQFHKDFTLDDAIPLVDYFADLGVSHIYSSPITTARAGSVHGYDVVDPTRVNPELGGEEALRRLVAKLRERGMGLIVDFVPNHMSVGGSENAWWLDVLKWGRHSPYAKFYDINWYSPDPELHGQLLLPFLGGAYGDILQAGELKLVFDEKEGFRVEYYAHHFPISPPTYADILRVSDEPELRLFADAFEAREGDRAGAHEAQLQLADSAKQNPNVRAALDKCLAAFDATDGTNHERLHALLERQHYRLASWRTASDDINWRRFFDITELGGLRMERADVFNAMHEMTFRLIREGLVDGLRLDHIDGLANPRGYCRKLRRQIDRICQERPNGVPEGGFPIFVEKILAEGEHLRDDWGIDGTTGYEFMNEVSGVMHDPAGEKPLNEFWAEKTGRPADFMEEVREARRLVVTTALASEFESTAHTLHTVAQQDWRTRDTSLGAIRRVLLELIVHFPVYRTYASAAGFTGEDEKFFQKAVEGARPSLSEAELPVLDLLHEWLGGKAPCKQPLGSVARREQRRAITKFQQLTSPVAAKAVEDTSCYRSGALLSRNDVGFDPQNFSQTTEDFHKSSQERAEHFPRNMLTTATHDHKRGEDTRARLAVISEMAGEYTAAAARWMDMAETLRSTYADKPAPTPGDELMLYQTLLASWPLDLAPDDAEGLKAYLDRLLPWQEKALREEKLESDWWTPNTEYEAACRNFLEQLITGQQGAALRKDITATVARIAPAGALSGMVQALLRMTAPGIPDLYQGCDFWDLSLVEPDNRRPVDYPPRIAALKEAKAPAELLSDWKDGRVKQSVIARTLAARKAYPDLFLKGNYLPLEVTGAQASHVLAFAREYEGKAAIVVVPLRSWQFIGNASIPSFDVSAWQDTRVKVPKQLSNQTFTETFSHSSVHVKQSELLLSELLASFPLGLLITQDLSQGETLQ